MIMVQFTVLNQICRITLYSLLLILIVVEVDQRVTQILSKPPMKSEEFRQEVFKQLLSKVNLSQITFKDCDLPDVDLYYSHEIKYNMTKFFSRNQNKEYPYKYVIKNDNFCHKKDILVIAVLFSGTAEFHQRQISRKTWANKKWQEMTSLNVAYLVGLSKYVTVNKRILEESKKYGDIIQGGFLDSYVNLTLKTLTLLHWTQQFCSEARWIIKLDTDVLPNIFQMTRFLRKEQNKENRSKNQLICYGPILKGSKPLKDIPSYCRNLRKFWVSDRSFPFDTYLPYCRGDIYIFTKELARKMYLYADKITPFKMEDAYYTGIVTYMIGEPILIQCYTALFEFSYLSQTETKKAMRWEEVLMKEYTKGAYIPLQTSNWTEDYYFID